MTFDNMQQVDIERVFSLGPTLKEINKELGNKVLDVWIDTGIRRAHSEYILPYEVPQYLDSYIKKRHRAYDKFK